MDYKSLAANAAIIQSVLAASGIVMPRPQARDVSPNVGYYGAAIILSMATGIGFLLAGLYMYLVTILPTYQVCLIMGAITFSVGLAILAARAYAFYVLQRKIRKSAKTLYRDIKDILEDVLDSVEAPISENPRLAIILTLLAGFILGKKFLDD